MQRIHVLVNRVVKAIHGDITSSPSFTDARHPTRRRRLRGVYSMTARGCTYPRTFRSNQQRQSLAGTTLTADQSKLVEHMAPLVKRIAYHFMARLPASVHVDDLIQAGLMGLLDAARNFDDTQGAQFETYAIQRIRGSILDELRQADWLP